MPLTQLTDQMTLEELRLWAAYFEIENDHIKKEQRRK